jgi:hypothetical protein
VQKIIVLLDDAAYAREQLAPIGAGAGLQATHWVLVACAPRMTQRISKWVTHSARDAWRGRWADKLFRDIAPHLSARGDRVTTLVAKGSLQELTSQLAAQHAPSRVLDARRPRSGPGLRPGSLLGMGMALVLAAD